jgi:hypothetical protein
MPNLQQIQSLRQAYFCGKGYNDNPNLNQVKSRYLDLFTNPNYLSLSFEDKKQRLLNIGSREDLAILTYLEGQQKANVVLLFIDITDFSKKIETKTNEQVVKYLDEYYDKVISIIYQCGGEVDKIMGDGIICIFGEPFLPKSMDKINSADKCAKEIITLLKDTDKAVKIALHEGEVLYYKNKNLSVPNYEIIGKMLTDLFRLESVADANAVNYYKGVSYEKYVDNRSAMYKILNWFLSPDIAINLKGVSYLYRKYLSKS